MAQNTVPTKNNLMRARHSLRLAAVGYDLMDRKRNILVREVMRYMDEAKSLQAQVAEKYREAYEALMIATVRMGDCAEAARAVPTDDALTITSRSVMGVELPAVTLAESPRRLWYSPVDTDAALDTAYDKFREVMALTAKLAETEASVCRLADAIKKTRKRTNALGNVMIPQLETTVREISASLEEKEREDFTRLKVIKRVTEE